MFRRRSWSTQSRSKREPEPSGGGVERELVEFIASDGSDKGTRDEILRALQEAEETGQEILADLAQQGKQIERAGQTVAAVGADTKVAQAQLSVLNYWGVSALYPFNLGMIAPPQSFFSSKATAPPPAPKAASAGQERSSKAKSGAIDDESPKGGAIDESWEVLSDDDVAQSAEMRARLNTSLGAKAGGGAKNLRNGANAPTPAAISAALVSQPIAAPRVRAQTAPGWGAGSASARSVAITIPSKRDSSSEDLDPLTTYTPSSFMDPGAIRLQSIRNGVSRLHEIASAIGDEVDEQNVQFVEISSRTDRVAAALKGANDELQEQLEW